jgi:riboflavin synthase
VFTGLVETTGIVRARTPRGPGARMTIGTDLAPLVIGESIAVQGACLTVERIVDGGFEADVSAETLARTTLGALALGRRVNLERSMQLGARMGGHIVTGHIDATIRVAAKRAVGEATFVQFQIAKELARFVASKGSVCIDGTSLTVNGCGDDRFDVVLVPHTQAVTTLGELAVGDACNVEVDLLARYVARILETGGTDGGADPLLAKLRAAGYLS